MELNKRQERIVEIVKERGPITGELIAEELHLTRATLRPDLAILTMSGFLDARPRVGYFYTGKSGTQLVSESLKTLFVKNFQSVPVVVSESTSVYDAIVMMFLEDVGTLFVIDKNNLLVGVLSRKDFLRASIGKQDLNTIPVNIIMTRMPNIAVCQKEDLIIDVAKRLVEKEIDSMPVVKEVENGYEVIGRMTKTNLTRAFLTLADA